MSTIDTLPRDSTGRQSLLKNPRFWLVVQMLGIVIVGFALGMWKGKMVIDSYDYIAVSRMPVREAWNSIRTLGYPLLLRLVAPLSPDYTIMPWVCLAMLCAVVFLLDAAIRRFGGSPWQAFAISTGFMYATLQRKYYYIESITSDFPAIVMAGATLACLLWVVAKPRQVAAWLGLAASLFASYQIRPVYLYLIPLAPCLGLLLRRNYCKRMGEPFRWAPFAIASAAASLVPYLAFCLVRFVVVGHFGLVSFAGCTLTGIAVELVDTDLAERELPQEYRPLAKAILKERERRGVQSIFQGKFRVSMKQYDDNCSTNVWRIAMPIGKRLYGDDLGVYNRKLASFSGEVIRRRPGKYLAWAAATFPWAAAKLVRYYWFIWIAVPLLAMLFLVRRKMLGRQARGCGADAAYHDAGLLACMTWFAVLVFLGHQCVLIASGVAIDSRHVVAAGLFVPPLLAFLILRELTLIRTARSRNA